MGKPERKILSRKQIENRIKFMRFLMGIIVPDTTRPKKVFGKEAFYETSVGRVRCLTYGFDKKEKLPLIANIHGSGFTMGRAEMDDAFCQTLAEKSGAKVISIDYSLSPEVMFPVALNECFAAIEFAKINADSLGIDGKRIIIIGHSAGGNFCAGIGLKENERNRLGLKGIVLDYPPTDLSADPYDKPQPKGSLPPWLCRIFDAAYRNPDDAKNPLVSPSFATAEQVKNFPPTLVITAGNDSLANETERFKDVLISAGVNVTFKRFENAPHGFTLLTEKKGRNMPAIYQSAVEARQMIFDFIEKYLCN